MNNKKLRKEKEIFLMKNKNQDDVIHVDYITKGVMQ